jgi:hypothetical protein
VLDNLWYNNYNDYVLLCLLLSYVCCISMFSSMLSILHIQIMYNVQKSLIKISMILFILLDFFSHESSKPDLISFAQNRSGNPLKPVGLSVFCPIY